MRLLHYLEDFPDYLYQWGSSTPFSKVWENPQKEHVLLISNAMVFYRKEFEKLFEKYYIAELFELSNCFMGTGSVPHMFLHIVDTPVDKVKISFYQKPAHDYRDYGNAFSSKKISLPAKYNKDFCFYINLLDSWVKTGIAPKDTDDYQFRTISSDEVRHDFIYTRYYDQVNDGIRALLRGETIVSLSDVAEITPIVGIPNVSPKHARILSLDDVPTYPYIPERDSVNYFATDVLLKKNDIVSYKDGFFLFYQEVDFEIYAPPGSYVIRAKSVSPEYLYIFLTSKIAKRIYYSLLVSDGCGGNLRLYEIKDLPVALPTEDEQNAKDQFAKLAKPERVYEYVEISPESTLAAFLKNECINRLENKNFLALKELLENDFTELKVCYDHKAYKAAVILAGSILEAFVIDWLSELDQVNYFQKVYPKKDKAGNIVLKRNGQPQQADLLQMMKDLRAKLISIGVSWCNEFYDADIIREKRNNVHAKLSMLDSSYNSQSTCQDIMQRLERVIKSRNNALLP